MVKTIIETKNMSFTYPDGTSPLHNINIEIKEGERVAIVGSNGAGKSTFLHILMELMNQLRVQ
jgi:cobalt/nickel transport system ATP-binding protein